MTGQPATQAWHWSQNALTPKLRGAQKISIGAEGQSRAAAPGEQEPVLGAAHPLLQLPNALCTPHLGYVERDNYERYFGIAFDHVNAFAAGRPAGLANPEVLDRIRPA